MGCANFQNLKAIEKPVRFDIDADNYVNIVPLPIEDIRAAQKANRDNDIDLTIEFTLDMVARCVVDDDLKPIMTKEDAGKLSGGTLHALAEQCFIVSGYGTDKKKD